GTNTRVERWTSADGINFVFQEIVVPAGAGGLETYKSPFIWLNPNDNLWYLYWHRERAGNTHDIMVRSAANIEDLDGAADSVVLTVVGVPGIAAPSMMYRDGRYWLIAEGFRSVMGGGADWAVVAYSSANPDVGF
ncbi:unnamed protein product, partial [marine sediment metagenome]